MEPVRRSDTRGDTLDVMAEITIGIVAFAAIVVVGWRWFVRWTDRGQ